MLNNRVLNNIKLSEAVPLDCYLDEWYSSLPKKAAGLKEAVLVGVIIKEQFPSLFKLIIEAKEQGKTIDHNFITKLIEIDVMINGQSKCGDKDAPKQGEKATKKRVKKADEQSEVSQKSQPEQPEKPVIIPPALNNIGL